MSGSTGDIIQYRLERAHEGLDEAAILWKTEHYNSYVSRLYYACFYAVSALLLQNGLASSTHSGTQNLFAQHFVKSGKVLKETGELYYTLFHYRQESDYKDLYKIDKELAEPWLAAATKFIETVEGLINDSNSEA